MKKRYLFLLLLVFLMLFLGYRFFSVHSSVAKMPTYVGAQSCVSCHQTHYDSWKKNTLHPAIFLPVTDPSQIKGDFEQNNALVTFSKDEITHVVGSKWEQVYMRMIDGDFYPFTAKWMVTTQKWVPYKVHKWKETPASTKCNGCHTTGYDAKSYAFKEFSVSCEACHGAGSLHASHQEMVTKTECSVCHKEPHKGPEDIIVSQKSTVCGQCHSRGLSSSKDSRGKMTLFNFPLNYKPGADINESFIASTFSSDKKGKNWWGNGVSKNRHQEFADFSFSGHSKSLDNLRQKKNPHGGKKTDDCLQCHSQDYRSAKEGKKPTIQTAKHGITCVTCHEPHGMNKNIKGSLGPYKCGECHVNSFATVKHSNKQPEKHFPCPIDKVTCADCHMPRIVKTGGDHTIRSHAFKVVPPEASKLYKMPNSCQNSGCHADKSVDEMNLQFKKFYPHAKEGLKSMLKKSMPQ